ncbi:hypothetical protein MCOR25_005153 [Pyricularia grisea]|uniref:Uncharacterized protein n=1 Tax=Pyricularia grisea TaxID=148305 RepID=A0A6P8BH58_PYRGI|nr:uncharacterized protein PgNI_01450 [Pyricularia grisea]KAI6366337.1 hypothetical protein MCOR25_005153 [Pyricularia grisea]TLD15987.1 hypothetical protein PgNI_01450 [Pyricularia grisea]
MSTAIPVPSSPSFGPGQSLVFNPLHLGHYQPHDQRHNQHQSSAEPMSQQKLAARQALQQQQCTYRDKTQKTASHPEAPPCEQQCSEYCPQNKATSSAGKRAQELIPPPRLEIRGKELDDKALISPLMLSESPRRATAAGGAGGSGGSHG